MTIKSSDLLKRYYDILGLPMGASKDEVKRAYRKLVKLYHPDRNSSPEAQQRFLLIQKAYDVINSGVIAAAKSSETAYEKRKREGEERLKKARERYRKTHAQEQYREHVYYHKLTSGKQWLFFKTMSYLCAFIAALLLIEFFLPHHFVKDSIRGYSHDTYGGLRTNSVMLVELQNEGKFFIENTGYKSPFDYHTCFLEQSWIFHQPLALHHPQNGISYYVYPIDFTVNSLFPVSIVLLLVPLFTVYYKRKNANFSILYHASYYFVFILLLLFLFTEDRWIHFLTAGFA